MSIRTFFNLLLRIIGLLFLIDCFNVVLSPIQSITLMVNAGVSAAGILPLIVALAVAAVYIGICYACFFRASAIIDRLKLDKNYDTDELYFGKNTPDIILISATVIGGYMVASAIPGFLAGLYQYVQQRHLEETMLDRLSHSSVPVMGLLREGAKIVIGLLIIGYRLQIANLWWSAEARRGGRHAEGDEGVDKDAPVV